MVAVHASRVARHSGEGGEPVSPVMCRRPDERTDDVGLALGVNEHAQGMHGAVGVPQPVVGIVGVTLIVVHLVVRWAVVLSLLADAYGAFHATVERSVEHCAVVVTAALDHDFAQLLVPQFAAMGGHLFERLAGDLGSKVALRLLGTDVGNGISQGHRRPPGIL